jgi:MFS family permease
MSLQLDKSPGENKARGLASSFLILNILSSTIGGAMQLVVPLYAISLTATTVQIGMIRGISGFGMLLLVIPAGFLVDHIGARKLFLIGSLLGTISTLSMVMARVPLAMIALMGLSGLFSSLTITALNASFYRNLREMGLEKAGWYKGSISIGLTFSGPIFGAFLVKAASFSTVFELLALLTLIPFALVFLFHKEPLRSGPKSSLKEVVGSQLRAFRLLLGHKSLHLTLFAESLSNGCFATFSTFIIVIAVQILHLPPTAASLLLSVEGGFFVLTVFAAGPIITKMSQFQLYLLSVVVSVTGLICVTLSSTFALMIMSSIILGLGLGMINLATSSQIGQMEGDKGKTVALLSASVGVGISLGPLMGGAVGQYLGTRNIFLTFIPFFLLLPGMAFVMKQQLGREH